MAMSATIKYIAWYLLADACEVCSRSLSLSRWVSIVEMCSDVRRRCIGLVGAIPIEVKLCTNPVCKYMRKDNRS